MRLWELFESDAEHQAALDKTGFWGRQASGCLFLAQDTGRICLAHRSRMVEQPGTWGTWGGALDPGEDPAQAVRREVREEAGYMGDLKLMPLYVFRHSSGFVYHNFLALVSTEFTPELNWETQGFRWVEFGDWPEPLHMGVKMILSDAPSVQTINTEVEKANGA